MRLQPQLYIDTSGKTSGEPIFKRVEFFDFESIELTSTVQDFRDINKIFTDYSKTFNIPASKTNNGIFRHFYNSSLTNGFDARVKQRAEIHINGILFKVGYVRLSKSLISSGKAKSYSVTFFGSLTNLSNVIGDAELSELTELDIYNHDYNNDVVYEGFTQGLQLEGTVMDNGEGRDIIYPAISANDKWFYDSDGDENGDYGAEIYNQGISMNLFDGTTDDTTEGDGTYGINYLSLKPAIKVRHIIDAIQKKYNSVTFSNDFFGRADFDNLYMLLHNNKGTLAPVSNSTERTSSVYRIGTNSFNSDFVLSSGLERRNSMTTEWYPLNDNQVRVYQYHIIVEIIPASGDPEYTVEVLDGSTPVDVFSNISGTQEVTSVLCTRDEKKWDNVNIRISSSGGELATFDMSLEVKAVNYKMHLNNNTEDHICSVEEFTAINGDTPNEESSVYGIGTQTLIKKIEITRNIPKMKILDFLKGIFKMFNLTAVPDNDGVLVIKTLNSFYDDGNTIDITNKVNTEEIGVNRMDVFKNIEFKFSDPKTFGVINNNEVLNTDFGNLDYQSTSGGSETSLIFDGKDYKVKLPFEKLYFERLTDEGGDKLMTEFGHGWLADKDQNEILTKPVLFYNVVQPVDTTRPQAGKIGFLGKSLVTQYNRPSNSNSKEYHSGGEWITIDGDKSINFNTEFDEYTVTEVNLGLFRKYYQNYISNIFNKGARVFDLEMKADISFLLKYKINDTLTIKGEEFLINNIRTNLSTGLTKLELILKFFIEDVDALVGVSLTKPQGLAFVGSVDTVIRFNWNANPIDELVAGYNIYVGGSLVDSTIGVGTNYSLSGLNAGDSYSIQVSAYNAVGDESLLSDAVSMSTASDTTAPTAPVVRVTEILHDFWKARLAWTESYDEEGVVGYEVYRDGVLQGTTTDLTFVLNVSSGVRHEVYVKALDAAGNYANSETLLTRIIINNIVPLTDANFQATVNACLAQDPINGAYNVAPYGEMSGWDVSQVTNMSNAFSGATSFNGNISNWDVSNVTNMNGMFFWAQDFNYDIGNWNMGSVTDVSVMFARAYSFNRDIGGWNMSSIENMSNMFSQAESFNQPINNWNVSNVVDMSYMFDDATVFNQDLSSWDVSSVNDMEYMFRTALNFNQDISSWDVSSVTNMTHMFSGTSAFNKDLSSWAVNPNVTGCSNFDLNATSWVLSRPSFTSCTI